MTTLQIMRIKPNPAGKDKTVSGNAAASQLAAEWVDFKNTASKPVDLAGIDLYHLAYALGATQGSWQKIMTFRGCLRSCSRNQPHDISEMHETGGCRTNSIPQT